MYNARLAQARRALLRKCAFRSSNSYNRISKITTNLCVGPATANAQFPASIDLSTLDGSNGFVLKGIDEDDFCGREVSGVGDINGDGFADVIIGAYGADPIGTTFAGECYIVFGNNSGFSSSLDLSALDGTNGFLLGAIDTFDAVERAVSGAGDVNGDGIDDLIMSAYGGDPNGNASAGETYVIFGRTNPFPSSFDLSALDGSDGFF